MIDCLRTSNGLPALTMQNNVLAKVNEFVGDAPQADDITLMVLVRDP